MCYTICYNNVMCKFYVHIRIRTLNPITDPNPNPKNNKKENDTGMKLNIQLYIKVDFLGTGWVYKRPITGNGSQTHGSSRLLVVLYFQEKYLKRRLACAWVQ